VDLSEIQAAYYMVAATGVLVAAVFYILNLRISQRNQELALKAQEQSTLAQQQTLETRQAQLFMQLSDTYIDKGYRSTALEMLSDKWTWKDFDDFMNKYGPETNPEAWNKFQGQLAHWSLQGMLIRDGLLSAKKLVSWWGWVPRSLWQKYEPIIVEYRRLYEAPPRGMLHQDFEDLYYAMLEEQPKFRKDFLERLLPLRAEKRKALGLDPIPSYQ
jgi:hypothetical protein